MAKIRSAQAYQRLMVFNIDAVCNFIEDSSQKKPFPLAKFQFVGFMHVRYSMSSKQSFPSLGTKAVPVNKWKYLLI